MTSFRWYLSSYTTSHDVVWAKYERRAELYCGKEDVLGLVVLKLNVQTVFNSDLHLD